ncbi:MAG: hypothetical protein R3C05_13745 [Pirellulaceae bacterium]
MYVWQTRGANASHQMMFRENPLIDISISLIIPMFAYFGTFARRYRSVLLLGVYIGLTLAIAGKRGPVLAAGFITLASMYRFNLTIPRKSLFVLIPLLICFLLTQRFLFRESFRHDSVSDFTNSKGGVLNVFFGTAEVSNAEVLSMITTNAAMLSRNPMEMIKAAILAPAPRSVIKSKPLGSSAHMTTVLSPERWRLTRSEVLVTGYGDLIMHLGVTLGGFILGIVALGWSAWLRSICRNQQHLNVFSFTLVMWSYYIFMRGDTFNLARYVWFYLFVFVLAALLVRTRLSVPRIELFPRPRLVR